MDHVDICKLPLTTTTGKNGTLTGPDLPQDCLPCSAKIDSKMDKGFNAVGGLGLFFSLTEVCWLIRFFQTCVLYSLFTEITIRIVWHVVCRLNMYTKHNLTLRKIWVMLNCQKWQGKDSKGNI